MQSIFGRLFLLATLAAVGCADSAHEQSAERSHPAAVQAPSDQAVASDTRSESAPAPATSDAPLPPPEVNVGKPESGPSAQAQTPPATAEPGFEARVEERLQKYKRMAAEEGIQLTDKQLSRQRQRIEQSLRNFEATKDMDVPMGEELDRQLNDAVGTQGADAPQMGVRSR